MKKKCCVISNIVLLCWYFLAMIGVYFGNMYLVTRSYKDEWIFMVIPLTAFIVFLVKEKIGKFILIAWLLMWFVTQFLSHEWYTIFGNGFMGRMEGKVEYFRGAIKFYNSKTVYIPDAYHTILHVLIIVTLFITIIYSDGKKKRDNSQFTE